MCKMKTTNQNTEIKRSENNSEALRQLSHLKEFYLKKGAEKGFHTLVN